MTPPRHRRARLVLATALAAWALLLGGCVYLRLLELKRQLGDFDRHFALETASGLRLDFLHPVLRTADIRWLGFEPASIRRLGHAEQWRLRWVKQPPPGPTPGASAEISFDLSFADDRLNRLTISDTYFAFMPKAFFIAGLKSLGGAKVDESKRSVESRVSVTDSAKKFDWPTRASVGALLGPPTEQRTEGARLIQHFIFVSADPSGKGGRFDINLAFDGATERLVSASGRTPAGNVNLNFTPPPAAAPAP